MIVSPFRYPPGTQIQSSLSNRFVHLSFEINQKAIYVSPHTDFVTPPN